MSIWSQREPRHRARETHRSGTWLKLSNDGDHAFVVLLSETFEHEVAFVDGKYTAWTERLRAEGHKPITRFAINLAVYPSREVKVFDQGVAFFREVSELRKRHASLEGSVFEVRRSGAPNDPKTTYTITWVKALTHEERRIYSVLPQHDLERMYASSAKPSVEAEPAKVRAPEPRTLIDAVTASAMATVLKGLPQEASERFLHRYHVKRVRDLPSSMMENAAVFLEELEADHFVASNAQRLDPFA